MILLDVNILVQAHREDADLCRKVSARGNFISDAYHAALALELGCEWVTLDRGFARFPRLQWRHPLD